MPTIFSTNTAGSLHLETAPTATDGRLEVFEPVVTSPFVRAEYFEVLPRRLWLSHSRAVAIGRRAAMPHNPTPELDIGSAR